MNGAHTADGKPLLANDTHLELNVPPIWYETHLTAPGWNVKGFTLPGAPLVVIGHNERIAWGFTNNMADVEDLYVETFDPANPQMYRAQGEWRKAAIIEETIPVKGQPNEKFEVVITRHGPIVHREGGKAYALHWTALEPGGLAYTYEWLGRVKNWDEFRNELKRVWGPGQNAVYADADGNIGYVMAAGRLRMGRLHSVRSVAANSESAGRSDCDRECAGDGAEVQAVFDGPLGRAVPDGADL
ncbi:MAG: hypothetical protein AUG07_05435 [Acidobacteria bacterium 13_1_20CM_2_60_10]|nr:MAG: hypothetical protein AUG07_05435 [Acidobacteria bacterium 13_1_20CM_2_60_10]